MMTIGQLTAVASHIDELVRTGKSVQYRAGQVLFYAEHEPYGAYVIHKGDVSFKSPNCSCTEESIFDIADYRVVGIDHIIDRTAYCCTCSAKTDCNVTFIAKTAIMDTVRSIT